MAKAHLSLHQTEAAVLQAAAAIYSAYIHRGLTHSDPAKNHEWQQKAVQEAIELARIADDAVQTETEFS